jgi:hypothetical protein
VCITLESCQGCKGFKQQSLPNTMLENVIEIASELTADRFVSFFDTKINKVLDSSYDNAIR